MSAPTTPILDNFNRANEGPPPSSNWANGILTNTAGNGLKVVSNQLARHNTSEYRQGSRWTAQTFGPNCEMYFTWPVFAEDGLSLFMKLVGSGTTWSGYSVGGHNWGTGTGNIIELSRLTNGTSTVITTAAAGYGAGDKVCFRYVAGLITLWRLPSGGSVWEKKIEATDTVYQSTSGQFGIEVTSSTTLRLDDFGGGTLVQIARPTSDINANWTPTPVWSRVDEVVPEGDTVTATAY